MTTILFNLKNWFKSLSWNLFLSVTSPEFYVNVFKNYKGYGIKYLLNVSMISSMLCCIAFLQITSDYRDYFASGIISKRVVNLDHVINQFPNVTYDDNKISIDEETPIFLNDSKNEKIIVIDPDNKLSFKEREKIPVILQKDKVIVSLFTSNNELLKTFAIDYPSIIGSPPQTLSQEFIISLMANLLKSAMTIITYILFPIFSFMIFINSILQNFITVLIVCFIIFILGNNKLDRNNFKSCIRLVFFASAPITLFHVLSFYLSWGALFLWALQFWTNLLMILGFIKANSKN